MTTFTESWLHLREDLTDPADLSTARREALVAVQRWAARWWDELPATAASELADAVGGVVKAHGGTVGPNAVEACRQEGRAGSVQELGDCMQERKRSAETDDPPPRRGIEGGSRWHDFLVESGDAAGTDQWAAADAAYEVCAAPSEARSIAEELLADVQ